MYSSFWNDIKHTLLTQWWILLVLVFVLSINLILKVNAADDVETVYYLDFCGVQTQMFREFVRVDGSKIFTDQNCILINHPCCDCIDDTGSGSQLISQYIISNQYFEILDNEKIIKPDYKIGNLYAAKIHDCFNSDLCFIQGGSVLFDGSDYLEIEIAKFYNAEIEKLIYENSNTGSTNTDTEHASVIEPDPVQEDPVQEPEPDPVQEDSVQEPEPEQEQEVKQSTTIVRSASSSGNVSTKQSNAKANYSDSMEGSPVVKQSNVYSSESSTAKVSEDEKEDESISSDSGNASTAKTSIDGEENVDDTTLHNDNIMLTVTLFVLGGLGVAMGITRLML